VLGGPLNFVGCNLEFRVLEQFQNQSTNNTKIGFPQRTGQKKKETLTFSKVTLSSSCLWTSFHPPTKTPFSVSNQFGFLSSSKQIFIEIAGCNVETPH
jgi:hypothetical protein